MAWDVQFRNGLWLPQAGWWLDAHHPVDRSFVSHAHFDHLAPHREILCSEGTSKLMGARMPGERREHILPFNQTESLTPEIAVTLYPAGHIFGSAQILLEHAEHGRLLYTGDFKLRRGLSAEVCDTPRADLVIMETTYGRPHYVLPPTAEVISAIIHFCRQTIEDGETPVLFGYSLGKSQEILSGLAGAGLPAMLHPQTLKLTRVYEELGMSFPPYRVFDADQLAGHVVICPPQSPASSFIKKIPHRRTAMITGWALDPGARFRYQCDAAFPLSDHADYDDLLRFVDLVQPRRVLTLHGFASDFARTLRDRGIEAWAIGQDNQLEMPLTLGFPENPAPRPTAATPEAAFASDSLDSFAQTAEQLKSLSGKLDKIALLARYLASLGNEDAALAALYFTGRPFPQTESRALNLGWSVIKRALLDVTGLNEGDYRRAYLRYSDSGDTAEAILAGHTEPQPTPLTDIAQLLCSLADARGPAAKLSLLQERLRALSPAAAKYLIKIITGDLRIGLKEGLVEEAIAASASRPVETVREANLLCGDIAEVVRATRENRLEQIQLQVFHPLQFMLASPEPTAGAILQRLGAPVWLEEKYDGIRCQVHKHGGRVELFSRDLHRITAQFPDLAAAAHTLPGDFIIDGELLAWRDGRALPFAELQKRLGRKGDDFFLGEEIPVSVSCYDLLWRNGINLLKTTLAGRRTALAALLAISPVANTRFTLAPVQQARTEVEIEAAFLAARQRGNEGLMAKDPLSAYTPGRRGLAWLKLKKAYATIDVVVVGVEYGHGKRKGVLSDYTFSIRDEASGRLLTIGKAYSGLTDVEIAELTRHFLENTIEEKGRYRSVVPDTVLEIAFDSIQPSKRHESGYALRFPRIARIRTDKTVAEIDTLATCARLAAGAFITAPEDVRPD
ncbi:ATP-dependent DNA ligase [Rariglobus hedericola]|uniref:DNA ligase n=2 Tax=Rariglobus hedericola TaxID=2597822 RepID=A0A556QSU1_9BACT|nr:ATP-dependent DNA ligase [Rariglobus hedericola]